MTKVLEALTSPEAFGVSLLVFAFLPGLVLRLLVCLYPKDHARRTELLGQLYSMPQWRRPWFVVEQLETALAEGLVVRARRRLGRFRAREQADDDPETTDPASNQETVGREVNGDLLSLLGDQQAAQEAIDMLIADLSPEQAEAVLLRVVGGFAVPDVAQIMERSPKDVRTMCHRALRTLAARFDDGDPAAERRAGDGEQEQAGG
jgi:Sigma-70, region 4